MGTFVTIVGTATLTVVGIAVFLRVVFGPFIEESSDGK
jgi:hypothetical protein